MFCNIHSELELQPTIIFVVFFNVLIIFSINCFVFTLSLVLGWDQNRHAWWQRAKETDFGNKWWPTWSIWLKKWTNCGRQNIICVRRVMLFKLIHEINTNAIFPSCFLQRFSPFDVWLTLFSLLFILLHVLFVPTCELVGWWWTNIYYLQQQWLKMYTDLCFLLQSRLFFKIESWTNALNRLEKSRIQKK